MTSTTIYTVYRSTDPSAPIGPNNTAGALITVLDAVLVNGYGSTVAAGWTKAYSGTNKAAYRQGAGSNGFYLRVDDTGTTSARVVMYETMSDVDTGTNPCPSPAQLSGGGFISKSNGATSRAWNILANASGLYIDILYDGTNRYAAFFGDGESLLSTTDAYMTLCQPQTVLSGNVVCTANRINNSTYSAGWVARDYSQTGASTPIANVVNFAYNGNSIGAGGGAYPDPVSGGLLYSKLAIVESPNLTRGYRRSELVPLHNRPLTEWDTFTGTGDYAGQTFTVYNPYQSQIFVRTS